MSKATGKYVKELRSMTGLTQATFADKYGISKRTIEEWESGHRIAPEYVWGLLERAVRQDCEAPWEFSVERISGESIETLLKTWNRFMALRLARNAQDQIDRKSLDMEVEVRLYHEDGSFEQIPFSAKETCKYLVNGIEETEELFMSMLHPTEKEMERLMNGGLLHRKGNIFRIEVEED